MKAIVMVLLLTFGLGGAYLLGRSIEQQKAQIALKDCRDSLINEGLVCKKLQSTNDSLLKTLEGKAKSAITKIVTAKMKPK